MRVRRTVDGFVTSLPEGRTDEVYRRRNIWVIRLFFFVFRTGRRTCWLTCCSATPVRSSYTHRGGTLCIILCLSGVHRCPWNHNDSSPCRFGERDEGAMRRQPPVRITAVKLGMIDGRQYFERHRNSIRNLFDEAVYNRADGVDRYIYK